MSIFRKKIKHTINIRDFNLKSPLLDNLIICNSQQEMMEKINSDKGYYL